MGSWIQVGRCNVENNYITKKINLLTALIGVLVLLAIIYSNYIMTIKDDKKDKANLLRIEVSSQKEEIKDMYIKNAYSLKNEFYNYSVIDLHGNILFSYIEEFKEGNKISLEKEIGYDNAFDKANNDFIRYSSPLVIDGVQKAILVIDVPKKLFENKTMYITFYPILLLLIGIIFIAYLINRFIKIDVIKPIGEIHKSAKTILRGNYEDKINYDYDGEIGLFCHDFEAMRDELKITKEREESLKRSEKELLACISHDLKTPLSSISGYVEGIRDGIVKSDEGIMKYTDIILKKSKELSDLIDDILEQSKTELNEMSFEKVEVYSDEYLMDIFEEMSLDVASKNMSLTIKGKIPRSLILVDPLRINQVITNIITNSIKYDNGNGKIETWVDDDIDKLIVNIRDWGKGICISDIPFVFNKFYRGEKNRNTNIPGSGLGLSIAKYIIDKHGGKISCNSNDEETTMSFTIPKI